MKWKEEIISLKATLHLYAQSFVLKQLIKKFFNQGYPLNNHGIPTLRPAALKGRLCARSGDPTGAHVITYVIKFVPLFSQYCYHREE